MNIVYIVFRGVHFEGGDIISCHLSFEGAVASADDYAKEHGYRKESESKWEDGAVYISIKEMKLKP